MELSVPCQKSVISRNPLRGKSRPQFRYIKTLLMFRYIKVPVYQISLCNLVSCHHTKRSVFFSLFVCPWQIWVIFFFRPFPEIQILLTII
uniref:Uncharacterized protein n=1 Tax=Rhizophagus irregularis (strain DAOM 181602 / DAOM 197198 / MUCL 43194) TaxID=747089 RepID=U9SXS1_RHIID